MMRRGGAWIGNAGNWLSNHTDPSCCRLRDRVSKRPESRLSNLRRTKGAATVGLYTKWLLRTDHVCICLVDSVHRPSNSLEHQRTLTRDSPYLLTKLIGILNRNRVGWSSLDPACPFCHWTIRSEVETAD